METSLQDRDRVGVQDAILLEDYTSEVAFVDNLHKRFKENLIYVSMQNISHVNGISIICVFLDVYWTSIGIG